MNSIKYSCTLFILLTIFCFGAAESQVSVPYINNFYGENDTIGWTHYATSGTDDWQFGVPDKEYFTAAYTDTNAWVTNLTGSYALNSFRYLETPAFDLTDTTVNYMLSFYHKRQTDSGSPGVQFQYSIDGGQDWSVLNALPNLSWQSSGFSENYYDSFNQSKVRLRSLQGNPDVRFRFSYANGGGGDGWMIDDFSITEEYYDIVAGVGDTTEISVHCPEFVITAPFEYVHPYNYESVSNTTRYYLSNDQNLDAGDILIHEGVGFESDVTIETPVLPASGTYYIVFEHDVLDTLEEADETNNISYTTLIVKPVFATSYIATFENEEYPWESYSHYPIGGLAWRQGAGYFHHVDNAHTGSQAWFAIEPGLLQYAESPHLDLSTDPGNQVISLWYKHEIPGSTFLLQYSLGCSEHWEYIELGTLSGDLNLSDVREGRWDFVNIPIDFINEFDDVRFRVEYTGDGSAGIIFDDVFVGKARCDLSVEREKRNRFTSVASSQETLKYYLNNSGSVQAEMSVSKFYWSTDSILDGSDILLGVQTEPVLDDTARVWTNFIYTKPTSISGKYYIFYSLDSENTLDEMREYDNVDYFVIYQQPIKALPYINDFESEIDEWYHVATLGSDDWVWTIPNKDFLDSAFSGQRAWLTKETGMITPLSRMHLYTPVFDLSTVTNPVIEFDMNIHADPYCPCTSSALNMSYSIDGGATWIVLDTTNHSFNRWYYRMDYDQGMDVEYYQPGSTIKMFDFLERAFANSLMYNGRDCDRNTHYVTDLEFLGHQKRVQFRFNLASFYNHNVDIYTSTDEGAMIDNFTIRDAFVDLKVNYKQALMLSSVSNEFRLNMKIKNDGNYISEPTTVKYYLSSDSLLTEADVQFSQQTIPAIRPDFHYYMNISAGGPSMGQFGYVLYKLDAADTNLESDEMNNIGYWPLALDSIDSYPYFNDFNGDIIDGWTQYSNGGFTESNSYRFRHKTMPAEWLYDGVQSGEWFNDRMLSYHPLNYYPTFYLESPSFDFSWSENILMSFKLLCTGHNSSGSMGQGGNLQYSINGGNTWSVLTEDLGSAYNWYNNEQLVNLNNEPGWAHVNDNLTLDSTAFDLSFLSGQSHVVFRFKYRSNHQYWDGNGQGMRLDDFRIEANEIPHSVNEISAQLVNIFRSNQFLVISLPEGYSSNASLNIFTAEGKLMLSKQMNLSAGLNHFLLPENLSAGTYLITLIPEGDSAISKLIVLN